MTRVDQLPPDQRAALSLILRRQKSYGELSAMLGIPEQAVHDRAHAALAVLAPREARALSPERREQIGEYLLGQQAGVAERLATQTYMKDFEPARTWASELSTALAPLAERPLPQVPAAGTPSADGDAAAEPATASADGAPPADGAARADATAPVPAPAPRRAGGGSRSPVGALPSSRLGGALLLGAIVAAIVVAVVLLTGGGGSSHAKRTGTSTSASSKSASGTTGPHVDARLPLHPTDPSSRAAGAVAVLSESGKRAFYIAAEHLAPSHGFYYAIWLYNSPTSAQALSRAPAVGSNGQLAGGSFLPSNAASFRELLLTRETSSRPAHPGPIALRGRFSLRG